MGRRSRPRRQLRVRGLTEIAGDLVLDRSALALPPHEPGEFDNEPLRPYNAGPDALLVNVKSVRLTLQPDLTGKGVRVIAETPGEGLQINNRLRLDHDACGDWRELVRPAVSGLTIELSGSFSAACGEKALHLAPWPADIQVEALFRALWRELGGSFGGRVRAGRAPAGARTLAVHESAALGEIGCRLSFAFARTRSGKLQARWERASMRCAVTVSAARSRAARSHRFHQFGDSPRNEPVVIWLSQPPLLAIP